MAINIGTINDGTRHLYSCIDKDIWFKLIFRSIFFFFILEPSYKAFNNSLYTEHDKYYGESVNHPDFLNEYQSFPILFVIVAQKSVSDLSTILRRASRRKKSKVTSILANISIICYVFFVLKSNESHQ